MDQDKTDNKTVQPKAARERSPAFPFISLKTAIDRILAFEQMFGRHPAPLGKAGLAWKVKPDSSQAAQTLSALKYFGLIEYSGATNSRVAAITEDARNFMRAQQESIKAEILKVAALRPKAIRTYWEKWGHDRPIDEICLDELVMKSLFTPSAAKVFLRVYDETVAFADLTNGGLMDFKDEAESELPPGVHSNMTTTSPMQQSPSIQHRGPPAPVPVGVGHKQDNFSVDEGTIVLQWPQQLSEDSFQDFEDWMEIQMRKIKRTVTKKPDGKGEGE